MPYKNLAELPDSVTDNLPYHGREIYLAAFNSAWEEYKDRKDQEEVAHKVAWSAVKKEYRKNKQGKWVEKK